MAEYRLSPQLFDVLANMCEPYLAVNTRMAGVSNSKTCSEQISVNSRVGTGLIMAAGGRYIEAMRTHGTLARKRKYAGTSRVFGDLMRKYWLHRVSTWGAPTM